MDKSLLKAINFLPEIETEVGQVYYFSSFCFSSFCDNIYYYFSVVLRKFCEISVRKVSPSVKVSTLEIVFRSTTDSN